MTEPGWKALQEVLLRQYDVLRARLTQRLGSADRAGDALQDAWMRLERGGELAPVSSPDAFVYRMALNFARDRWRAETRRLMADEVDAVLDVADEAPGPAQRAEGRSELQALKAVMRELPRRQRAILLATRLDGITQREIGARLGISERLVQRELKAAQSYCLARLRALGDGGLAGRQTSRDGKAGEAGGEGGLPSSGTHQG